MSAASQARRRRDRADLEIVAFERGHFTSYSACGIPYWIGGAVGDRDDLVARDPQTFRDAFDIDVRLRHEVTGIDLDRREVHRARPRRRRRGPRALRLADVRHRRASRRRRTGRAIDAGGVFGVQTLDDGAALRGWLEGEPAARRAVVVGGGYVGVEMAEALIQRGLDGDRSSSAADQPMSTVDPDMAALVRESMRGLGIELRTGVEVTGLRAAGGPGAPGGHRRRRNRRPTSWCSASAYAPTSRSPRRPGCRSGPPAGSGRTGGCRCGAYRGVWAAGDCVETAAPGQRHAGARAARHARQQAGPGGGHQHRRRLRHLPRGDRHGGDEGLRAGGCPHRAARARRGGGRVSSSSPSGRVDQPGRLLPGRAADDGQADRRALHRPAARGADRRRGPRRPSGSTRSPWRSGTA